jgi:hypothetical protein
VQKEKFFAIDFWLNPRPYFRLTDCGNIPPNHRSSASLTTDTVHYDLLIQDWSCAKVISVKTDGLTLYRPN